MKYLQTDFHQTKRKEGQQMSTFTYLDDHFNAMSMISSSPAAQSYRPLNMNCYKSGVTSCNILTTFQLLKALTSVLAAVSS